MGQIVGLFVSRWQQRTLLHEIKQVLVVVHFPQNRYEPGSGTVLLHVGSGGHDAGVWAPFLPFLVSRYIAA
jgi:hypothetical protein